MSLLTEVMKSVKPAESLAVEQEQEQEPEREEIKLDGFIQLQKALRQMEKDEGQPLQDEVSRLETKMATEQAIVDAYTSYDVAKASREPDFDRSAAAGLAANAEVASQILSGLEGDLEDARHKLSDIHKKYGRLATLLRSHGEQMDKTRRAVAIEYARNGRLRIDKDHAKRWLGVYVGARKWMEATYGEKYQSAVDYCLEQLSHYEIPASTTSVLFQHMTKRDQESLPQFKTEGK